MIARGSMSHFQTGRPSSPRNLRLLDESYKDKPLNGSAQLHHMTDIEDPYLLPNVVATGHNQ